jgi:hypothetical protein
MFETAAVMIAKIFVLTWAVMEGRHYILVPGSIGGLVKGIQKILLLPDTLLLRIKCHCIYLVL